MLKAYPQRPIRFQLLSLCLINILSWAQVYQPLYATNKAKGKAYILPLKLPVSLSGNFAEIRTNHFHTGIDFKTQRTTGHRVFAVYDGIVSRIRTSSTGYGKALYIDHPDGHTSVYAHLENFNPYLEKLIKEQQYKERSFEIDWHIKNLQIHVSQGDCIAYSGNTGSSQGPHLHFEIRHTQSEQALNPLQYFYPQIPDTKNPILQGLMVYAQEVNDKRGQSYFSLKQQDKQHYTVDDKDPVIKTYGAVSFGLQGLDRIDGSNNRCGFHRVQLWIDDSLYYQHEMDTISFDQQHFINSFIDYSQYYLHQRRIQRTNIDINNQLQIYTHGAGIFTPKQETHHIRFVAQDLKGNTAETNFIIAPQAAPLLVDHEKYTGHYIFHNQVFDLDEGAWSIHIPKGAFYTNQNNFLVQVVKASMPRLLSPLYQVHDPKYAPIQEAATLSIQLDSSVTPWKKKIYLAHIDKSNQETFISSRIKGEKVIGKINTWGNYGIFLDTIAPHINLQNRQEGELLHPEAILLFTISDEESGIAKYEASINGQWALFEYDPKTKQLSYQLDPLRVAANQTLEVSISVWDECNNKQEKTFYFSN